MPRGAMTERQVPAALQAALGQAVARLRQTFGARLIEVRLFGSHARGEAGPESDVDVFVLLDEVRDVHDRSAAMGAVIDVGLELDLPLEPMVLGVADLEFRRRCETALARALDEEGVVL
jgi:predicted nucleotidyltransferase